MRIIIDGYNLIRRVPELREIDRADLEEARESLLRELSAYRSGKGHRITVVFDGAGSVHLGGSREKVAGITVVYSAQGRSADQAMGEMFRNGQADVAVSADREVAETARRAGVTPVTPEHCWDRVQEEAYRRYKGEEPEDAPFDSPQGRGRRKKSAGGRKLSKEQRRDRGRIEKL